MILQYQLSCRKYRHVPSENVKWYIHYNLYTRKFIVYHHYMVQNDFEIKS